MMTLRRFQAGLDTVPGAIAWYLSDLGEARGKQELFTRQAPQRLKALRENALIESVVSSNRIEGVEASPDRMKALVFGKPVLRDRDEEEIRGYREALRWIHEEHRKIPLSEKTVRKLHQMTRGRIWDAGKYKEKDGDIIERLPDGETRVRFKTVSASGTPAAMGELVESWKRHFQSGDVHPLILLAAFNLDFLCIHPFRDGNGRVSRLLLLLQLYHLGYEVGRYISLERLIEDNKERYYESLEQSSSGWHAGKHNPWPYSGYLFYIFKSASREFEERVGELRAPRGEKTPTVIAAIGKSRGPFRVSDLHRQCPGVSLDLIRKVLKNLQAEGRVRCLGRGVGAQWTRVEGKS